jgi:hypothetical protein
VVILPDVKKSNFSDFFQSSISAKKVFGRSASCLRIDWIKLSQSFEAIAFLFFVDHRNPRTMWKWYDQNGPKMKALPSADKSRLTRFRYIIKKYF